MTDLYFQTSLERYFAYPENARTFGMAGSSTLTSRDSSSIYGNPAGLAAMQDGEFSASYGYNQISGDEFPTGIGVDQKGNFGSALLAVPIGPTLQGPSCYGNLGLSFNIYDTHWQDDSYDTSTERQQVSAAYAIPVSDEWNLGYSLGWTDEAYHSEMIVAYPMHEGFLHTLGADYQAAEDMRVGLQVNYGHGDHRALYGPGIVRTAKNRQLGIGVGLEYDYDATTLLAFLADYTHLETERGVELSIPANVVGGDENGNIFNLRAGVEHSFNEQLRGRAGYRFAGLASYHHDRVELNPLSGSAYHSAFALGLGYTFNTTGHIIQQIGLDYGVEYRTAGDGDFQHLVTIVIPFEMCRTE